ncbi:hypothetical protein ACLOJK_000680 [Asimina triloba]
MPSMTSTPLSVRSPMKDLSLFLLKNSLAAKMKKGLRSFCNGMGSTSTLNQHQTPNQYGRMPCAVTPSLISSYLEENNFAMMRSPPATLEDMIMQLELEEEEAARKKKASKFLYDDDNDDAYDRDRDRDRQQRRMSCVNNSDILRSARNALNQYPRFSLDGRDAMYRSSFRNYEGAAADHGSMAGPFCRDGYDLGMDCRHGRRQLPSMFAGESVVWCKPGVVAQLMGLDLIPLPASSATRHGNGKGRWKSSYKGNLTRINRRHEYEKRKALFTGLNACGEENEEEIMGSSSSRMNYHQLHVQPISVEPSRSRGGWPIH